MVITITNANDTLLKALKGVVNLYPQANLKVKKEQETISLSRLETAIAEVESGKTIKCSDFKDFKKKVLD